MTNDEQLAYLTQQLDAAKTDLKNADDDAFESKLAIVNGLRADIVNVNKKIESEKRDAENAAKRDAVVKIGRDAIAAAIFAALNPDDENAAKTAADTAAALDNALLTKIAAAPRATAANGATAQPGSGTNTATIVSEYKTGIANGQTHDAIAADLYSKYKRSTVWHALNKIKNGTIAI